MGKRGEAAREPDHRSTEDGGDTQSSHNDKDEYTNEQVGNQPPPLDKRGLKQRVLSGDYILRTE